MHSKLILRLVANEPTEGPAVSYTMFDTHFTTSLESEQLHLPNEQLVLMPHFWPRAHPDRNSLGK
eukprot:6071164-Amphidinium_carterae.1